MRYLSLFYSLISLIILFTSCQQELEQYIPDSKLIILPDSGNTTTMFELHGLMENSPGKVKIFYRWDFNNDLVWETDYSNDNTLPYRFLIPGSYSIHLNVLTAEGIEDDCYGTIVVTQGYSPPRPYFLVSPDSGNFTKEFYFDASLTQDDEDSLNTLEFRWDVFNDGKWETFWDPDTELSYTFNSPGYYSIKLAARDPKGMQGEYTRILNVHTTDEAIQPIFSWTSSHSRVRDTFNFDASATMHLEDDSRKFQYQWKFHDDDEFTSKIETTKIRHIFSETGDKNVTLRVTDQFGLTNQNTQELFVYKENRAPIANIGFASQFANIETNLFFHTWHCSDDRLGSSLLEKRWDLDGDGNWDTPWQLTSEFLHQFTSPGEYLVRLQVKDDGYNTDLDEKLVFVSPYDNPTDYIVDKRDGQYYSIVKLGESWWMAENLKYQVVDKDLNRGLEPFQYYNLGSGTIEDYGLYYNIGTSIENRDDLLQYRICPSGWRIPTKSDWEELFDSLSPDNPAEALSFGGKADFNATHTGYINRTSVGQQIKWEFLETTEVAWFMSATEHEDQQRKGAYVVRLIRTNNELWVGYENTLKYIPVRCIKE